MPSCKIRNSPDRIDLTGANFNNANLDGAAFINANLTGAKFTEVQIYRTDFTGVDLTGATFSFKSDRAGATLSFKKGYKPEDTILNGATLEDMRFRSVDFNKIAFDGSTDFRGADLRDADFLNFRNVDDLVLDFTGADLQNANFEDAILEGGIFSGANLENANMKDARMRKAKFISCELENADFSRAILMGSVSTTLTLKTRTSLARI